MPEPSIAIIRRFRTAQFVVIVDAVDDNDADMSWDDEGETTRAIERGDLMLFAVRTRVLHDVLGEVSCDYLGGCVYKSPAEFQDHRECAKQTRKLRAEHGNENVVCGSYFASGISEAIAGARKVLRSIKDIRVREAA